MSSLFDSVLSQAGDWRSTLLALPQNVQDYLVKNAQQIAADPAANARAAVAGGTKGITTDLAGGPVDLVASMYNQKFDPRNPTMLGAVNSAAGYISDKLGQPKPALPEKPVGGSEWLADYAREKGLGPYIDQPPGTSDMVYEGSRILAPMAVGGTQVVGGAGARAPAGVAKSQAGLFGGVLSEATNKPALRDALALHKQGVDMDAIRDQTGWFKDAGKKWTYEFSDRGSKYIEHPELTKQLAAHQKAHEDYLDASAIQRHRILHPNATRAELSADRASYSGREGPISDEAFKLADTKTSHELNKEYFDNVHQPHITGVETRVGDVLKHNRLYKDYPGAADIQINFKNAKDMGGDKGRYNSIFRTIDVDASLSPAEMRSVITHELQHWIQKEEGFGKGGSASEFGRFSSRGAIRMKLDEINQQLDAYAAHLEDQIANAPSMAAHEAARAEYAKLMDKRATLEPKELYMRLFGEAQARAAAEKRLDMTPKQRAKTRIADLYDRPQSSLLFRPQNQ